jgi:predicted enzyme related to lactoylglutathione lyase
MDEHKKISYVEFFASNLQATKSFFITVFNWFFVDYGPDYTASLNQGIENGFFASPLTSSSGHRAPLVALKNLADRLRLHMISGFH